MWPALIPGDILRAREKEATELLPGQVVVLGMDTEKPFVHRVVRIEPSDAGAIVLYTAGDRSGPDLPLPMEPGAKIPVVIGVLVRGRYRAVARRMPCAGLVPPRVVGLFCGIARRTRWR